MSVSEKIKQARKAKKLSQKDLAVLSNSSQPTIYNIEKGSAEDGKITLSLALKIAKVLDASLNDLFEIEYPASGTERLEKQLVEFQQKVKDLEKQIADKELLIEMFKNEKVRFRKDVIHFLEEIHDQQTYYLKSLGSSIGLNKFQMNEIQNSILNMFNTIASSYFLTTGLIEESDFDKITGKYIGKVRPGDPKKQNED